MSEIERLLIEAWITLLKYQRTGIAQEVYDMQIKLEEYLKEKTK